RLETIRGQVEPQGSGVGTGVAADPAMAVDIVQPEIIHIMAIRLGVAVHALAEKEGAAQLRCQRHGRAPGAAARPAPFWVPGRRPELGPGVVAERLDLRDVRAGLTRQAFG